MITAHSLIQVYLIAPQLLLWIALTHHGNSILTSTYLYLSLYFCRFEQHAIVRCPH
jgi:hypothetical protein